MSRSEATRAKERVADVVMRMPGVCGLGVTRDADGDGFAVAVFLRRAGEACEAIRERFPDVRFAFRVIGSPQARRAGPERS